MGKILNHFWVQNISLYYVPEAVSAETAAFYGDPFCRYLFAINGTSLKVQKEPGTKQLGSLKLIFPSSVMYKEDFFYYSHIYT